MNTPNDRPSTPAAPRRAALIGLALAAWPLAGCSEILWRGDLGGALKQADADGRLVLVYYSALFNADCHTMETTVFRSDEVIHAMAGTIPVKLTPFFHRRWAAEVGVSRVPAFVIYRSDGHVLRIREGLMDENRFRAFVVSSKLSD